MLLAATTVTAADLQFLAGRLGGSGVMDGTGSAARFESATDVWVSPSGDSYVAEPLSTHVVRKVSPSGKVTTIAGRSGLSGTADGTGSAALFQGPWGITGDGNGNLYLADVTAIRKVTAAGDVFTLPISRYPSTAPDDLFDILRNSSSNLLNVLANDPVSAVDPVTVTIQVGPVHGTVSVVGSPGAKGQVYITYKPPTNYSGPAQFIYQFSDGQTAGTATVSLVVTNTNPFQSIQGITIDGDKNIYVTDYTKHTVHKVTSDGTRSVIAGKFIGSNDGIGEAASFFTPWGIDSDSQGNLYVADSNNNTLRKITPAGVVSTLAGAVGQYGWVDGTGASARFYGLKGIGVDSTDNIYVSDGKIRKVTPAGVVSTVAGGSPFWVDGTGAAAGFGGTPYGLARGPGDVIFIADSVVIRKMSQAGLVTTLAGLQPVSGLTAGTGSPGLVAGRNGLAVNTQGTVFLSGKGSNFAQVSPFGVVDSFGDLGMVGVGGYGIAIDDGNQMYTAAANRIWSVTPEGVGTVLAGSGSPGSADGTGTAASFRIAGGIAVDGSGSLLVADTHNDAIRKVTPGGIVTTVAGTAGEGYLDGPVAVAKFTSPTGVAVHRETGDIYVAEPIRIRKIDTTGVVSTVASVDFATYLAEGPYRTPLASAAGLVVDQDRNIFVADQFSGTVQHISPTGVLSTFVGVLGEKIVRPGSNPRLNYPVALAIAGNNLLILDGYEAALLSVAIPAVITDTDADGTADVQDNCTLVANLDQRDTDGDGYGNLCDADLNNSGGIVNFSDLALFRSAFGTSNPNADLDSSGGIVNFTDLARFRSLFGKAPGPSGVTP
ncbi:MAG: hypothetical protein AMXMBFR8_03170 [Nevskiales bacterium]